MPTAATLALWATQERQIVGAFRASGALSVPKAQRLHALGLKNSRSLQALLAATIIRKAGPDRFFLDEAAWQLKRGGTRRPVMLLAVVLLVVGAIVALRLAGV